MDPEFLTLDEVLAIHVDMINEYGGSPGIRDQGLLKSAVAMPAATFGDQYLHSSLHEMAAAYLFHLVQNHPFVDGNKRTGAASALVFLSLNQHRLTASQEDYYDLVISVSEGQTDKAEISTFLKQHSESI